MKRFIKYALIASAILAFYYNSYIGVGLVGIAFLAYIGFTGKPRYKTPKEIEEEKKIEYPSTDDLWYDPMYSNIPGNIYHNK